MFYTFCHIGPLFTPGLMQGTSTHVPHWDSNPRHKDHKIYIRCSNHYTIGQLTSFLIWNKMIVSVYRTLGMCQNNRLHFIFKHHTHMIIVNCRAKLTSILQTVCIELCKVPKRGKLLSSQFTIQVQYLNVKLLERGGGWVGAFRRIFLDAKHKVVLLFLIMSA
jgi:hypothetical protein